MKGPAIDAPVARRYLLCMLHKSQSSESWIGSNLKIGLPPDASSVLDIKALPWPVIIHTGVSGADLVNERNPAVYRLGMTRSGERSLGVWIHNSVPEALVDIVAFHEVVEAELRYVHDVPGAFAHRLALRLEQAYARENLSAEALRVYQEYRRRLPDYSKSTADLLFEAESPAQFK